MSGSDPPEHAISEYDKWHHENSTEIDTEGYDFEELDAPGWITDLDREICDLLSSGLVLTPSVIAKNLDRPRSSVSRRINTLEAGGIIEKVERGHYHMTGEGWSKMHEKVPTELEDGDSKAPEGFHTIKVPSSAEAERISKN